MAEHDFEEKIKRQMGDVIEYRTMDYYRKRYERKNS